MIRMILVLASISACGAAWAEDVPDNYTAETMMNLCKGTARETEQDMQSMVCTFRIQGVVSMTIENCRSISAGYSPFPAFTSAVPPSKGASRQAFLNYMEDNPQVWDQVWHSVVAMALSEAFPCDA